jgi:tetratricopeptide (TPR) repeat protein
MTGPEQQDRDGEASPSDPRLRQAADAFLAGQVEAAERLLRTHLDAHPRDVDALKMLAEVAIHFGLREDAEQLLAQCLGIAPAFRAARYRYAEILFQQKKAQKAVAQVDLLLADNPDNPECLGLKAVCLTEAGDFDRAISCHEQLLRMNPERQGFWLNYASDLRAAGRQSESIAAYRATLERFPGTAEAYWSLGNLKTFRFEPADIEAMQTALRQPSLPERDRSLLHYALGKVFEDAQAYAPSFDHYARANALRKRAVKHDADRVTDEFARISKVYSADFFSARSGVGCPAPDPIFIVGLPRSGSTLLAQILSSHPAIEATDELVNIDAIAGRLDGSYPENLEDLDRDVFEALGEEYLEDTRALRPLGRPFFVDKMPDNFRHVGLIHLILPNARIVDMRRHPLACGFSNFKQDFEVGYTFANDLEDFGRYYRDYAGLMDHFDQVLPGKVFRAHYEWLIESPEPEIRRLLDFLGLPFDEKCLRFHERDRAIRTASSEQVRTPLFASAVDQWRHYEPWLEPLKLALGPLSASYPVVPPPFT